jgi:hypothetical protein
MNEKLLREYINEILLEGSTHDNEITYRSDWEPFLSRFVTLGGLGQNNTEIGDWGEKFAPMFVNRATVNTNDLYKDHNFPFADLVTEKATIDNITSITFYAVKASASSSHKAAANSKPSIDLDRLINYPHFSIGALSKHNSFFKGEPTISDIIKDKIKEKNKNITLNVGLIAFDYVRPSSKDALRVQVFAPLTVEITTSVDGRHNSLVNKDVKTAYDLWGNPDVYYSLLQDNEQGTSVRKDYVNKRNMLKNKLKKLSGQELMSLTSDISCSSDNVTDKETTCNYAPCNLIQDDNS